MVENPCERKQTDFVVKSGFTPRALLDYRLSGGVEYLIILLAERYNAIIADINGEQCSSPRKHEEMHTNAQELLEILGVCCHDCDFSTDFASNGGHAILKKFLADSSMSSELIEEVENIIGAITLSGNKFPSRMISSYSVSVIVQPTKFKFFGSSNLHEVIGDDENMTRRTHEEFTVYLRSIPASIHGTGQHTVGYLLWSSAVILSRFIIQNEAKLVTDKSVLECGAGLGLCGIVAGRYASRVTVTDFSEILVQNLDYNIST
jgi:Lysine methyltransferase